MNSETSKNTTIRRSYWFSKLSDHLSSSQRVGLWKSLNETDYRHYMSFDRYLLGESQFTLNTAWMTRFSNHLVSLDFDPQINYIIAETTIIGADHTNFDQRFNLYLYDVWFVSKEKDRMITIPFVLSSVK